MPDYNSQQQSLNRRRQLAAAMQQQSMLPIEQPNYPGASVNAFQGLTPIVQALFAGLANRKLDKQQGEIDTQKNAQMAQMAQALQIPPEMAAGMQLEDLGRIGIVDALAGRRQASENAAQAAQAEAATKARAAEQEAKQRFDLGIEANRQEQRQLESMTKIAEDANAREFTASLRAQPAAAAETTVKQIGQEWISDGHRKVYVQEGNKPPEIRDLGAVDTKPETVKDERIVQIMGPNGTPIWVKESQAIGQPAAQAARAVTGAERQVLAYYNRALGASETITQGGDNSLENRIAKSGYLRQLQGQGPNVTQTQDQQSYRQAQRAFTEARLRKESGAAIPPAEYENDAKTYFAVPGDDAKIVEQKRQQRQIVLDGLKFSSGKAYDEFYGESGKTSAVSPPGGAPVVKWGKDPKTGKPVRLK